MSAAVPVGVLDGLGARVDLDGSHGALGRAIGRRWGRGVSVEAPRDDVPAVIVGAPTDRMGPEAVRAWRRWVAGGGRLLVVGAAGGDGTDLRSDAGLLAPGVELAPLTLDGDLPVPGTPHRLAWTGSAWLPRGRARLELPDAAEGGRLWPRGRGWFRFGRTLDVHAAWPIPADATATTEDGVDATPAGHGWLHLGLGEGHLLLLGDHAALADAALSDPAHAWLLSHVVEAWLPAPEPRAWAAWEAAAADVPDADDAARALVARLDGEGLDLMGDDAALLHRHGPALRLLGEDGLARADAAGRVRLTEAGRGMRDRIAALLALRSTLRAADAADATATAARAR